MVSRRCAVALLALLIASSAAGLAADGKPARIKCPVCSAEATPAEGVVVTDFRAKAEIAYCGVYCALMEMAEKYPASRAIAHSPANGKEIRIIRTGVRWVAAPETAVFLIFDDPKLPAAERWRVFDRQAGYMQFLLRHRDLIPRGPKLARLPEVVRLLTAPPAAESGKKP